MKATAYFTRKVWIFMIVTVTMNPAIDKTVKLNSFIHGGLNRISDITMDAGGKGINVSKTIKELGGETVCTGFVGGHNGKLLESLLADCDITTDFVEIDGETRINTKIAEADGTVTELNEAGPLISEEKQAELLEKLLQYAQKDTWFVLSGSVPSGMSKNVYYEITEKLHEKGAKVFLDADGELFANGVKANPDAMKPNRVELEKYVGASGELDEGSLVRIGQSFQKQGIDKVIISLGGEGAFFFGEEEVIYSPAIPIEVKSTVGAGDAVVAAFCYGMEQGYAWKDCIRLSIATSAGAVSTEGTKPPKREVVDELIKKIVLKKRA